MKNSKPKLILNEYVNRLKRTSSQSGISRRDFLKSSMSGLAATLISGCHESSTGPSYNPKLTVTLESPTITPTPGLSKLGLAYGRDGLLYVPESYSPETAAPLFVGLHGAGGASSNWTSYHARAEARGMVLLLPDSRSQTWDLMLGVLGPDVEFLNRALQHTFERCRIDPNHLALGVFSDGASYALSLGVSNGDLFSHLVAYSPGFFVLSDATVSKPQIYVSHGTYDDILPVLSTRNNIVPTLINEGYDVTYEEFDGGHEVPAIISQSALDWFLDVG